MKLLTTLTTKGQITIPAQIRERLGLSEGDTFVAMGKSNIIILKKIKAGAEDFGSIIAPFKKIIKKLNKELD